MDGEFFGLMCPPPPLLSLLLLFECIRQVLFPSYQFVGQKELIAPCLLHPDKPGVTFVLGGNTGSPSLSVFVGFWCKLVEELGFFLLGFFRFPS